MSALFWRVYPAFYLFGMIAVWAVASYLASHGVTPHVDYWCREELHELTQSIFSVSKLMVWVVAAVLVCRAVKLFAPALTGQCSD